MEISVKYWIGTLLRLLKEADRCGWRGGSGIVGRGPMCPPEGNLWHNERGFSMATETDRLFLSCVSSWWQHSQLGKLKKRRAVPPVSSSYSETQQQLGLCWDSYVRTDRRTACLSAASQPWRPFTYGNRARRDVVYGAMVGKMDES